jgi:hypothetical protein
MLSAVLLSACGPDSDRFRLEGRFRKMNQAEFYIYSPDGGIEGIDTITVREGRFAYEAELRSPATFVIVFPNFSEQPVFAEPGASVTIKGDASHMKEMTIQGTRDNEDMTEFRLMLNDVMPPDVAKTVADFIREHPASPVSIYLLKRYLVYAPGADLKQALQLTSTMLKQSPDNGQLIQLKKHLASAVGAPLKSRLPLFTATDVKGQQVSESLFRGKLGVASAWASWSTQSGDQQHRLKQLQKQYSDRLAIVSICIDGSPSECRRRVVEVDSLHWPTVCDGRMCDSPLMQKMGFTTIPANLIVDRSGTVVERNLTPQQLEDKIKDLLR